MISSPREVLQRWIDAFNARDPEAAAALYSVDAVNTQFAAVQPTVGRDQMLVGLREFFLAFPDSTTVPVGIYSDGEWAMVEWDGAGTWHGPFLGLKPTGRSFKLRGCGFFRIVNGLIVEQRGYWDKLTWFGQIGLPVDNPQHHI